MQTSFSFHGLLRFLCILFQPQSYLEIGVAWGESLKVVLEIADLKRLVLVDNWQAKKVPDDFSHVDEILKHYNMEVEKYSEDSKIAVPKIAGEFNLILVDGYHGYETAKADILNSLKLLSGQGVLVAHDYVSCIGVRRAFDEVEAWKLVCRSANSGLMFKKEGVKDSVPGLNVLEDFGNLPEPWTGKKLE